MQKPRSPAPTTSTKGSTQVRVPGVLRPRRRTRDPTLSPGRRKGFSFRSVSAGHGDSRRLRHPSHLGSTTGVRRHPRVTTPTGRRRTTPEPGWTSRCSPHSTGPTTTWRFPRTGLIPRTSVGGHLPDILTQTWSRPGNSRPVLCRCPGERDDRVDCLSRGSPGRVARSVVIGTGGGAHLGPRIGSSLHPQSVKDGS